VSGIGGSLQFVGIDPNTGHDESPTVWVDTDAKELVVQGWKPGPQLEAECAAFDERVVRWNHFGGDGSSGGPEYTDDSAAAKLCAEAFEAVWARAVPHEEYEIR
jgi:hypothetical protein